MTAAHPEPPARQAVIITGGSSGLGRTTAHLFATEDADVLIVGRDADRLAETAKGWPTIHTLRADVTEPDAPAAIVDTALAAFGRIDVLVNNAAVTTPAMLGQIDRAEAVQQIKTNLLAPIFVSQEAVRHMLPGSVIVNIGSNSPTRGWPHNSIYGSTKVSLDFLTATWARELAPRGIRVVSVAPGPTQTSMLDTVLARLSPEEREIKEKGRVARIPLGRIADPEEIAWWIVTVTRPEASYMTGAVVRVDGGVTVC
jgi:NAD(P)-dependent dehydrogenase (short-subunit alcohol dehydrogenase family)